MIHIGKDRATGLIVSVIGVVIVFLSLRLPPSRVPDDIGPAVFPILAACIMIITGCILIARNEVKAKESEKKPYFSKEEWTRFAILLATFLAYFFLLWLTGFIPATIITMYIMCTLFSVGKDVKIWKRLLFAVIVTTVIYCAFFKGLGLRLPIGTLIQVDL